MRKKKMFNATLVTAVAASGIVAIAPATTEASTSFTDVKQTDYFYQDILNLQARGIIKGFEDGSFRPNQAVTRGQVAKILAGVLGLDTTNVKDPGFKDIPQTHQYYGAIAALANAGIISGFEDGTFRQGDLVLRNHMAKMLTNGFNLQVAADTKTPFTDVRADYSTYITALYANNITTGKTATTFDGASNVTRGQLATFVVRAENATGNAIENETAKEVTFSVDSLTQATVKTSIGDLKATAAAAIFKASNAEALKNAQVTALVKGNEIVSVKQLILQAASTKDTPVTFDGGNAAIENTLVVKSAFVTVKNVTAKSVSIENVAVQPVASLQAVATDVEKTVVNFENVNASMVDVKRDQVTLRATAKLGTVTVAADVTVFELNAAVAQLTVVGTPKITLATTAKIDKIVIPDGKAIGSIIANYNSVKANIAGIVNTKGETVKVSTGGGGGGSSSGSNTNPTPKPTPEPEKQPEVDKEPEKEPEKQPDKETDKEPEKDKEDFPDTGEGPGPDPDPNEPGEEHPINPVNPLETREITVAGTYGPETGTEVIEGNLTIHAADVTLQNVTVTGKLILAAGIGEGDVHLKGVNVAGETIVNGGGKNSVYFTDSVLATVIVNKNNGAVRIVAQGQTQVYEVQLESPTIVVEKDLPVGYSGFDDIIVTEALQVGATSRDSVQVELQGVFETVNSRVANVRINLNEATNVQTLLLNALSHISGAGTIQLAQINASGSTLSTRPQNLVLDIQDGYGHVTIGEGNDTEQVTESYSDPTAEATVTGIRATQGVIDVEMTKFIAGLTVNDFDVVAYVRDEQTATPDTGQVVTSADTGHVTTGDTVFLSNLRYDAAKKRFTFTPLDVQQYQDQVIEIRVTPKHEKLSKETVISAYTVTTGFGGRITDILGVGIANLTIQFRRGAGVTSGDVVAVAVTDDYGYYTINLLAGTYTGEFTSPGYVTTYMVGTALSDGFLTDQNETAIRAAASQEVKIMLTWDEHPRDLDSHLQGPGSYGDRFHIYYGRQQHTEAGTVYADLDWDDVDSYGPETTTIRKLVDGEYRFFIHHFSGQKTLRTSGAKVSVFLGNAITPTQTFEVPTGEGREIYWDVFDLVVTDNGEKVTIRPINTLNNDRRDALQIIQNGDYWGIRLEENATQESRIQAVQQRVNRLYLPEGTDATVSYDEVNDRYSVTYVSGGSIQSVTIYPEFYIVSVEDLIYQAFYQTITVFETDSIEKRLEEAQVLLDRAGLPEDVTVTVSYNEETNQYVATYVRGEITHDLIVYPEFYVIKVENVIQEALLQSIYISETATIENRLQDVQLVLDNLWLPTDTNARVSYDEETQRFTVTYEQNGTTNTMVVYPAFYVWGVSNVISNAFNYYSMEFKPGTTYEDIVVHIQNMADELQLPESIRPIVAYDESINQFKVGFDLNGYFETVLIYPNVYVTDIGTYIVHVDYQGLVIPFNASSEEKLARIQYNLDHIDLPEGTNAKVFANDYDGYSEYYVEYTENDELRSVYIYPDFVLGNDIFTVDNSIQITTTDYLGYIEIESIYLIAGTTADVSVITFDDTDYVDVLFNNNNIRGTVITFDAEKASGIHLSTVQKVMLKVRNEYGDKYTIQVDIVL